jgi:hypothetical protein
MVMAGVVIRAAGGGEVVGEGAVEGQREGGVWTRLLVVLQVTGGLHILGTCTDMWQMKSVSG